MSLELKRPTTQVAWDQALLQLPSPHLLQTWTWGAFKSRHGWETSRYLWRHVETGRPQAASSILARRLGFLPIQILYVPKGPMLDYANEELLARVLERLESIARQSGALFIKIDPDVRPEAPEGEILLGPFRQRRWRRSEEEIQFRNTLLLDLTPSLDDLLMGMKSKWRYNVRLAKRKNVTVRQGSQDDLSLLYSMYEETASRGGFVIRPEPYYHDAWGSFMEKGLAQSLIAEVEGEPIAMVVIYRFGERAIYMYGASFSVHREKMPNNLLQWKAIQWAKKRGCTVYDMWGAPEELDESDPLWGVYRFKKGFGGEFVDHVGAWDYPAHDTGYSLYRAMRPRLMAVMRWLHWQTVPDSG